MADDDDIETVNIELPKGPSLLSAVYETLLHHADPHFSRRSSTDVYNDLAWAYNNEFDARTSKVKNGVIGQLTDTYEDATIFLLIQELFPFIFRGITNNNCERLGYRSNPPVHSQSNLLNLEYKR